MNRHELQGAMRVAIIDARRRGDDDFADYLASVLKAMNDEGTP